MDWGLLLERLGIAFLGGAASGGLLLWFARSWIEARLQISVGKELASFQSELDGASAGAKFEFERRLHDYSHFVRTRHRSLAELHRRIFDAVSRTIRFAKKHRTVPMIESWNQGYVRDFLEQHEDFSRAMVEELVSEWDRDREGAYARVLGRIFEMQGEHARRSHAKAHNYRLRCSLYLPDPIDEMACNVLEKTARILSLVDADPLDADLDAQIRILEERLQDLRLALKRALGAEAKAGALSFPPGG